jgi:hypothetical protein
MLSQAAPAAVEKITAEQASLAMQRRSRKLEGA